MPAGATLNVFPVATVTGCPVQVPHRYRVVAPEFQISSPTRDQALPVLVHETVLELEVAAAETAFQVMELPPVVYPVPPVSCVMAAVAVGVLVPSRIFVAATAENAELFRINASRFPAIVWSNIAITSPALQAARTR
jgi:hypothetical protein